MKMGASKGVGIEIGVVMGVVECRGGSREEFGDISHYQMCG